MVERGYGLLCRGSSRLVGAYRLSLVDGDGVGVYIREGDRGSVEKLVTSHCLVVQPLPPVYYPERLAGHVMLRLRRPLVLEAGEERDGYLVLEVDVGVFTPSGRLVDVFPASGRARYALYGPPEGGLIARYVATEFTCTRPRVELHAVVPVRVANRCGHAVEVSRVVAPAGMARLFYRGVEVVSCRLGVVVAGERYAFVTVQRCDQPPGFMEAMAPGLQGQGAERSRFVMAYGY